MIALNNNQVHNPKQLLNMWIHDHVKTIPPLNMLIDVSMAVLVPGIHVFICFINDKTIVCISIIALMTTLIQTKYINKSLLTTCLCSKYTFR